MNKFFLLITFTTASLLALATLNPGKPADKTRFFVPTNFYVTSSMPDASLDQNHSKFELHFEEYLRYTGEPFPTVELSCNGVIETFQLDSTLTHTIEVSPGKYRFMIMRTGDYQETITDSVAILPGYLTKAQVNFTPIQTIEPIIFPDGGGGAVSYKPVIYFYSPKELAVNVELAPNGTFTYTYPAYENGWKGTVKAKGGIDIRNKHYPYLFWEGTTNGVGSLVDYSEGYLVEKENITAFLEEKLTEMGLNDQERTDFITFWGPRMVHSEKNHVQFLFNEEYDDIAALNITPKPDHQFRLYMLWTPVPESADLNPAPQELPAVRHDGFSVVEWGGSELKYNETLASHD